MIIYFVLIFLISLIYIFSKRYKNGDKVFLFISFLLLTFVSGLRNRCIGVDTNMYVYFFEHLNTIGFNDLMNLRYEYGFSLFSKIISLLTDNYHIYLLIVSSIINASVLNFISKNSKNKGLSVILFILCNFYFSYMNIMRQALALSIILFSFEALKKKKKLLFAFLILLASQFHFSAIICLIFIFLNKIKLTKKHLPIILLTSIIFFIYGNLIFNYFCSLSPRLASYIGTDYSNNNYFGALFESMIIFSQYIFGLIVTKKNNYIKKENNDMFIAGGIVVATIISVLTMKATIFNRILHYFSIITIVWTPNSIENIVNKKNKTYITVIIILAFLLYFTMIEIYRPEWYGVVPYKFLN